MFFNDILCAEERAIVEQKTMLIKGKRVVEETCVLLCLCVLSLLNLYCGLQTVEQQAAGHISGIQQLDNTLLIYHIFAIFLHA